MGVVVDVIETVGEAIGEVGDAIFGSSRSKGSGPRLTYRKREEWDRKHKELQDKRTQLENERSMYVLESGRYALVEKRMKTLQQKLADAKQKLASFQQEQQREQKRIREEMEQNICEAVLNHWGRAAQRAVENIYDNCPQLKQLIEEKAENYTRDVQRKNDANFQGVQQYRDRLVKEKLSQQKGYQEALDAKKQLEQIIRLLSSEEDTINKEQ